MATVVRWVSSSPASLAKLSVKACSCCDTTPLRSEQWIQIFAAHATGTFPVLGQAHLLGMWQTFPLVVHLGRC